MKKIKEALSRLVYWMDGSESNFLYAIPGVGGIKSYRMREQARLLSHAADDLDEISYRKYYKIRTIAVPIAFECVKIVNLIGVAHGIINSNIVEFLICGFGYGICSEIQSNITPTVYNLKKGRER